ncbi:Mismatch repair protein msh3 [Puccinia graminis f. sp. tritici]|uniref:DNA mismatch repair protein MSH3 n=1 Tax=Puccinia graminis f. sp. tritici TaxID=56615 RepID=A0A5B0MTN6_PUCGR|nr:Mismatch repair protein msh3 [Puccinia graminis f. sp. tritici]
MLPSRFFQTHQENQPSPSKKLKQDHPTLTPSSTQEQEQELPSLSQLIELPSAKKQSQTKTPPSSSSSHHHEAHQQPIQAKTASEQQRPPSKTRLAQFLNTRLADQAQSLPSSDQTKSFQAKIAARASKSIKWEQPQSIWEPGAEQKKPNNGYHPSEKQNCPTVDKDSHDDDEEDDEDEEEEEEEEKPKNKAKLKGKQKNQQTVKLTQLEQQWAEFKKQYPNLVIFMEVGYKIRLFGEDAVLASQVLSIGHLAIPGRETAYFPKTSLYIHMSRMVMAGHKIGLFVQSETRSLRNTELGEKGKKARVFGRHLAGVYSLSTWTESDPNQALGITDSETGLAQNWIVSFHASSPATRHPQREEKVQLSMAAICPQNGEIVWDSWLDDPIRSMLETRMTYLRPVEILVPLSGLDGPSEKLINWLIKDPLARSSVKPRLESTDHDYTPQSAYKLVSNFCQPPKRKSKASMASQDKGNPVSEGDSTEPEFLHHIVELPDGVLIALAGLIVHMKSYQLESIFRQPGQFKSFINQSYMILDANTLKNLEIFENSTDRTERGSLFWVLDRTKTAMGKRILKQWIGKPLVDQRILKERADAIEEIIVSQNHPILIKMRRMLGMRLPDLEKSLVRIQYGKCTEKELLKFLEVMVELTATFGSPSSAGSGKRMFNSSLLQGIFEVFSAVREQTIEYRSELNAKAILKGEYEDMFTNADELYPDLTDLKDCLSCIQAESAEHLQACRITLQNPKLEYVTIGSDEMLIEVRHQQLDRVPENWTKFSSTRAVQRFRTAEGQRLLAERDKYRALIVRRSRGYFEGFLESMEEAYDGFRDAVNRLGLIDCLLSLATVAVENRYARPRIVEHPAIEIRNGRHPIVEQIIDNPLVPNTCSFTQNGLSTMILTGNNMGGKSVTAKMIGCIVLLAQIGSYVPAERAKIGLFDGCYTRMGMSEELAQGRSAFMVEMNEAAKIMRTASPRSLVIIDELGYGTSTYDGLAIANAVLNQLVSSIRCFTIFITHYPQLNELAIKYPERAKSYHMKFLESQGSLKAEEGEGEADAGWITFLYKLTPGLATKSHGIHVARLAGLPTSILHQARLKSRLLEESVGRKKHTHTASLIKDLLLSLSSSPSSDAGADDQKKTTNNGRSDAGAEEMALVSRAETLLSTLCLSSGIE